MNDRASILGRRSKLPIALVCIGLTVLLILLAGQLWASYRDQVRSAEVSTRNLASMFETRLDATLRRTDADLQTLAAIIPPEAMNQAAVPRFEKELNANLDSRLFNIEEMAGYRVHDANGAISLFSPGVDEHRWPNCTDWWTLGTRSSPSSTICW